MKRSEMIEELDNFIKAFEYAPGYIQTNGLAELIIDFINSNIGPLGLEEERDVTGGINED
jgi:hypothetical protein